MSVLDDIDDSKRLKVMTVEYTVDESGEVPEPIVHVFARDEERERHHVEVEGFHPYFYITFEEYLENKRDIHNDRRVRDVDEEPFENGSRVTSMDDEPLVRIYTTVPKHVGDMREDFDKSWEGDVFFHNRFLISEDIYLGITTPHTGRVHVDDTSPTAPPEVSPHVFAVDIEVIGDDGMPSPKHASKPVSAITSYSTYREEYVVWVLESDVWDERPDFESNLPDGVEDADIHVFESENRLLADFNSYVADVDPDLLTGWNSSADDKGKPFDYPYLINRSKNINEFGVEDWSPMGDVYTTRYGACACKGREFFDMLPAYDKTQTSQKRSYRLEYIAQEELGYGKEEISGFREAWEETPEDFIKYNIRDTQAVVEIMEQMDIIPLFDNLRRVTGALYGSCYNNIDMIDMLFLRKAQDEGLALPTATETDVDWYHGAEVIDPEPGKHENVFYGDLASLYPMAMATLNISPDSIIGDRKDLEESDYTEEEAIVGYHDDRPIKYVDTATEADMYKDGEYKAIMRRKSDGGVSTEWTDDPEETPIYFEPKEEMGFISGVIEDLVDMKYEYKGQKKRYEAVKRVTNSCFTPDTDIVTTDGKKKVCDIDVGDEVYSLNTTTGLVEEKRVYDIVEKPDYKGSVITIQNDEVDISVTPDHRVHLRREDSDRYEVTRAGHLANLSGQMKIVGWHDSSKDIDFFTFTDDDISVESAEGGVYCPQVEDTHMVVAGRNEKFVHIPQCYGVIGDGTSYGTGFRLFDQRLSECITMTGRAVLNQTADAFIESLEDMGYENPKIVGGDTDACMVCLEEADGRSESLDAAFSAAEDVRESYDDFMEEKFNVDGHEMDVEVESYAETCFFSRGKKFIDQPGKATKKRYAQRITWDENDGVIEDPDPDVAGFDLVRSNTSEITAEVQEEVLRLILESDEPKDGVYEYLEEVHEKYMDGEYSLEKIGRPKAISSKHPDEYGYEDPPKTPQPHIRGAKYATKNIRGEDIGKGSKPLLFHIDDVSSEYPQTYTADTLEDGMEVDSLSLEKTDNFPDGFDLDYETQFGKTVKSKLKAILVTMGWSWSDIINPGRQQDISKFM